MLQSLVNQHISQTFERLFSKKKSERKSPSGWSVVKCREFERKNCVTSSQPHNKIREGKWRFQLVFLSKFEFVENPFGFVWQIFVSTTPQRRSTTLIQIQIYRIKIVTTCRVLYLLDPSIKTEVFSVFSPKKDYVQRLQEYCS